MRPGSGAMPSSSSGSVSLVCMPWNGLNAPSIAIGTLKSLLRGAGIECRTHSLHLEFAAFAARSGLGLVDYAEIGDN